MTWRYTHIQEGNDMNTIYQINCNWQWWDKHISIINMWKKRISCKSNQPTCEFIEKIIAKDTSFINFDGNAKEISDLWRGFYPN